MNIDKIMSQTLRDPWGGRWILRQRSQATLGLSIKGQILLWAGLLIVILFIVETLGSIMLPFVCGGVVGYLLNPVAQSLQTWGLSRLAASLIILAIFVGFIVATSLTLGPVLFHQLLLFSSELPDLVIKLQKLIVDKGTQITSHYENSWLQPFGLRDFFTPDQIQRTVEDLIRRSGEFAFTGLGRLAVGGVALLNVLSFIIVTPVVAFYILVDWQRMMTGLESWIPYNYRVPLHAVGRDIDKALAGFLPGQSTVCLFLGLWYGLGLSYIGLNFALLIGVVGAILGFIPYIGSLTVLVFALAVALVQKWPDMNLFFEALTIVGTGQLLEGYVVTPKLVGDSIGLHPIWLLFALFAFGALFGFSGLLIATPITAALGVVLRHILHSYLKSPLYNNLAL